MFIFRKNFGDIEVEIFFDKYDFDYKRSVAAALHTDDLDLQLSDEKNCEKVDLVADLVSARQEEEEDVADSTSSLPVDRPRSGKEARQRRAERIASARSRTGGDDGGDGGDADKGVEEEKEEPVGYEEYER